jgi:hypothetical protein
MPELWQYEMTAVTAAGGEPAPAPADTGRSALVSVRRVGAAGLALGLCIGAAGTVSASADVTEPVRAVDGLLGSVDGGLLGGLVDGLLHGEGGLFGHEGGVVAGDDKLGDVVGGFAEESGGLFGATEVVGAVGDVLADPNIGGEGSFGGPSVGGGVLGGTLGGVLGGLLSGGTGLLGGVF